MIEEKSGHIRITDHKTGRVLAEPVHFIGKGEVLQPLLYAQAAEVLLGKTADQSRLFYCTETGGYRILEVPINDQSRDAIKQALPDLDQLGRDGLVMAAVETLESFRASFPPLGELRRLLTPVCEHWLEACFGAGVLHDGRSYDS